MKPLRLFNALKTKLIGLGRCSDQPTLRGLSAESKIHISTGSRKQVAGRSGRIGGQGRLTLAISLCLVSSVMYGNEIDDYNIYCSQAGGRVEEMAVTFSTSSGDVTGPSRSFCMFTPDNGLIAIGLESFSSMTPSIAATYMKMLPEIDGDSPLFKGHAQNPSYNVCKNLGGALVGFVVNGGFSDANGSSDICVFGDGSMVSSWSLIYMANHRAGYDEVKNHVNAEPLNIRFP